MIKASSALKTFEKCVKLSAFYASWTPTTELFWFYGFAILVSFRLRFRFILILLRTQTEFKQELNWKRISLWWPMKEWPSDSFPLLCSQKCGVSFLYPVKRAQRVFWTDFVTCCCVKREFEEENDAQQNWISWSQTKKTRGLKSPSTKRPKKVKMISENSLHFLVTGIFSVHKQPLRSVGQQVRKLSF